MKLNWLVSRGMHWRTHSFNIWTSLHFFISFNNISNIFKNLIFIRNNSVSAKVKRKFRLTVEMSCIKNWYRLDLYWQWYLPKADKINFSVVFSYFISDERITILPRIPSGTESCKYITRRRARFVPGVTTYPWGHLL